ncbi:MAG TPA: STN domain-containing protein, partial [Steroidobacteraceae bacterium]
MAFIVAAAFMCTGVQAQILVHFDLPAQSLARSLKEIGTATNTDVGFSANQVAGLIAPSLKADLTVDGALMRVLAGTGLRPQHLDDHTIVIAA